MDRRTFIAALTSTPIIARHLATAAEGAHLQHIGVQLYTVRSLMNQGMETVLATIAAIGYKEVEFAGYFDVPPQQVREFVRANGLSAPSTHVGLETEEAKWQEVVDRSAFIGHTFVTVPGLGNVPHATADDWKRVAALFNKAGEACKASGLQFAYHNHQDEFKPVGTSRPYDILLKETDPKLVKFEMDVAWATAAGADPAAYFAKYPGRFPLLHVKDLKKIAKNDSTKPAGDDLLEDVGSGRIDWKKLLRAAKKHGTVHHVVEHDSPADPVASIRKSYAYLSTLTV